MEFYRICIGLSNLNSGQGSTKGSTAIEREREREMLTASSEYLRLLWRYFGVLAVIIIIIKN
jgi:hypothetical protein